jgi:phosphoadenosine phosphosulfate reductase
MKHAELNEQLHGKTPEEIIAWDYAERTEGQVMTTSFGIESTFLIHMATRVNKNIPVIFIDTGYLFPETYQFGLELVSRFGINLKVFKSRISPEEMEAQYGKLWETDLQQYHQIRKLEPLRRAYTELGVKSVLHGVRAYQTQERQDMNIVEQGPNDTIKIHPVLHWTEEMVFEYFKEHNLPYHPLLTKGYGSVGDIHSTVIGPGRTGRYPGLKSSECGIHLMENGSGI